MVSPSRIADLSVRELVARLADPEERAAGAVAAAVALASAAACVELVLKLAARRRTLAPQRREMAALYAAVGTLRESFLAAGERDKAMLAELFDALEARRAARDDMAKAGAEQAWQQALRRSIEVPLALAAAGVDLLRRARDTLPFATRFTTPDVAGAASMAHGAVAAVLLMAEVNIALLDADPEAGRWAASAASLRAAADALGAAIGSVAARRIAGVMPPA